MTTDLAPQPFSSTYSLPNGLSFVEAPETEDLRSTVVATPIGGIVLIGSSSILVRVELPGDERAGQAFGRPRRDDETLVYAADQLREYFEGARRVFALNVAVRGSEFQTKVWASLGKIPFGSTATYGEIAANVGNAKASRAVGMANNRNPIALFIPCHRVIGASGRPVGYGGGLPAKEFLLRLERGED